MPETNDANTAISPATRQSVPNTRAFAASTSGRRGTAANVTRISPDEYSLVMASTPSTPVITWPMMTPASTLLVGSLVTLRVLKPVTTPSATVAAIPPRRTHHTERTLRSLIHSIAATFRNRQSDIISSSRPAVGARLDVGRPGDVGLPGIARPGAGEREKPLFQRPAAPGRQFVDRRVREQPAAADHDKPAGGQRQ